MQLYKFLLLYLYYIESIIMPSKKLEIKKTTVREYRTDEQLKKQEEIERKKKKEQERKKHEQNRKNNLKNKH